MHVCLKPAGVTGAENVNASFVDAKVLWIRAKDSLWQLNCGH